MQECTYATTTYTSSAVNHSFVFIWWAILINQIKILLTLHLTQHVCCFSVIEGPGVTGFVWMTFGFSGAKVGQMTQGEEQFLQGGSTQGCRLSQKPCPGSVPPAGDRGGGKTALLRTPLNAASLEAFFLSSEGTGPNHGSNPHNLVLCRAVKVCAWRRVWGRCLCVEHVQWWWCGPAAESSGNDPGVLCSLGPALDPLQQFRGASGRSCPLVFCWFCRA